MTAETAAQTKTEAAPQRNIRKVAVLGAGIMGSRIALHFANIGVEALLLDMVPRELTDKEKAAGLSLEDKAVRDRLARDLFQEALKSKPAPLYDKSYKDRVTLGNFDDDLEKISDCDWVVEVIVERLDIKQQMFERVEQFRKPGSLVTSNTSGIPLRMLAEGRSEDFQRNFCGTHFFNPPRYLQLLEIIPAPQTAPAVVDFLMDYGKVFLGKKTVLCKDTPAFIANRVGIFAIMDLLRLVEKYGLTVEETDKLTGPLIGHPKSATFRTLDLVGLDTTLKVAKGIQENCPEDERKEVFEAPAFVKYMNENKLWGDKTGKGFYKKTKNDKGEREILSLNFETKAYDAQQKVKSPLLEQVKTLEGLEQKFKALHRGDEKYAEFLREATFGLLAYVSHRVPEITDELFRIDEAISAGFGWKLGAFEQWDVLGVKKTTEQMKAGGFAPAAWVDDMLEAGFESFYRVENGRRQYYDQQTKAYKDLPGQQDTILLDALRATNVVWKNGGATIFDLGDDVLGVEFNTKMNAMGGDVLAAIHKAIDFAEDNYRGVVVGNQSENFSAGANLGLILMLAIEQEYDELDFAVRQFQRTTLRARYSAVPVAVAPHGMTLGGGCELTMHSDIAVAAAETYIGLVEVGVGLIPGGGGTKETVLRISDAYEKGDVETNILADRFMSIATAKVATSAVEAEGMNILREGRDRIVVNKDLQLAEAKRAVLELSEEGYTQPLPRKDIRVLGRGGLGMVHAGTYQMQYAGYASEHDRKIAEKLGYIMCGGDLSEATQVSEQYLLDLEREAFLSLCGERKTLERIQHMMKTGKPLRN